MAFAREGARIAVVDLDKSAAERVADELSNMGAAALALPCDVGSEREVQRAVAETAERFGRIDAVINCAQSWGGANPSLSEWMPLETIPEEQWDEVFQTGVKATWYFCKAVLPHMKERGGKIVNFGSLAGVEGLAGMADYAANKEAIRALSKVAAREWGQYGINVNVICPLAQAKRTEKIERTYGAESSEMTEWQGFLADYRKDLPIQRLGDPVEDIGRTAVFLASDASDYITGQTFMVDGGAYMG